MTIAIHIDPAPLLHVLDERGWTKGEYNDEQADAPVCLHGAVRLCSPQPGDAHLIEQVATKQGWGTAWNDSNQRTEAEVRDLLAKGINITDADLADTFGPMWLAITQIVRRAATLTPDEAPRLDAARVAARVAARAAARVAARAAAWDAAWAAARDAAWTAARAAAWDAAWAAAVWDLATEDGPFTFAHRDLLMAPFVEVCGLPEALAVTA